MATTPVTSNTETLKPAAKTNRIGLQVLDYRGGKTTLCAGCGHNAISERIIDAFYEMGVQPERLMKLSGIGCSSKSPAYFMNRSHSFNSVHGRMPSVATGALLANHTMKALGVSGDGDTGSIGMGQFVHMLRRNLPIIYIIEDNGVYGLTKGQFSATADVGSKLKTGVINDLPAIDLCSSIGGYIRGAVLLGRQEAVACHVESSNRAQRHCRARCHFALRYVQ
jgi:2-oxoglutarate ferredoxin oxidoreductase subunit beta